ncbi:MAG: hypothetical protein DIU71_16015, partial [Proteobacteria bacterium]
MALTGVLVWRERRALALVRAVERLASIVDDGRYGERVQVEGPAAALAASANRALEQMAIKELLIAERERSLTGVLAGLNEAVAVHRETIVFANERFALLTGHGAPGELVGRALAELVHPDYTELVREHLKRALAAEPGLDRLEIELHPERGETARAELSAVRIEYQGGPALLLTMVEMSPRSSATQQTMRSRPTAWETLDSLGEGVITTEINGRIDYINQAAEQLVGVQAIDALGKSITEIITLVDESDRRSLGDPVRQCLATKSKVTVGRRGLMISRGRGDERSVELTVTPLKGQKGDITGTVALVRDVSESRGLARQMSYQASHDALT